VVITRRLECSGVQFVVIRQPDSSLACLPVWMTQEAASHFEISDKPRFSVDILRSLRTEVDALLGFLLSESKTEEADNDAPIRKSPAEPFRGGHTARIDLAAEQKANLAPLVEALLREIATALAKGESSHDQDHD
jgi:hypothetical protein